MNKITWEEIIIKIRKEPAYRELVELAYFEEDLALNVERFRSSEEFEETLKMLRTYTKDISDQKLLDLGADRKSTRLNSSHSQQSRMPSSA